MQLAALESMLLRCATCKRRANMLPRNDAGTQAPEEAGRIAEYYEQRGERDKAGDMWAAAGQHDRAVALYVQVSAGGAREACARACMDGPRQTEESEHIQLVLLTNCRRQAGTPASLSKAIGVVERAREPQLAAPVADAIAACAGLEGAARDGLLLRLNMAAGRLGDAARNALELARMEQVWTRRALQRVRKHARVLCLRVHGCHCLPSIYRSCWCACALPPTQEAGNYKLAHAKLLGTLQELRRLGAPVPRELDAALTLLHSYVLVKSLVGLGDHAGAAHMLVRVAGSISRCGRCRGRGGGVRMR